MTHYPRILVLSNNSFSLSNSNGRTLGSLFHGWPKDRIAQFCVSSDGADFDVCNNYYCITDGDVMHSLLTLRAAPRHNLKNGSKINSNRQGGYIRHRKTSFKMLCRNTAWILGLWKGKEFWSWVDTFCPDVIMLQNGDSYFMLELALDIKRQTKAKLMVFNTEGYYLFKHNYYSADTGFWDKSLFKIYKRLYNGWFRKLMKNVSYSIYGNELLKADYDIAFNTDKSDVIYTSSELVFDRAKFENKIPTFSYLGNLGLDRHKSLIEIGEMLQFINCNYYLDVYGQSPNNEIRDCLLSSKGIRFQGLVEYEKVKEIIRKSDILFHVENQANKWLVELKYAFSTKIADSIASGKLFILYASDSIACAKYILDSKAGAYVRNKDELIEVLTTVISVKAYRDKILDNAEKVALENHNKDNNSKRMHALVCNVVLNS